MIRKLLQFHGSAFRSSGLAVLNLVGAVLDHFDEPCQSYEVPWSKRQIGDISIRWRWVWKPYWDPYCECWVWMCYRPFVRRLVRHMGWVNEGWLGRSTSCGARWRELNNCVEVDGYGYDFESVTDVALMKELEAVLARSTEFASRIMENKVKPPNSRDFWEVFLEDYAKDTSTYHQLRLAKQEWNRRFPQYHLDPKVRRRHEAERFVAALTGDQDYESELAAALE